MKNKTEKIDYSIVIPVYNSEKTLEELIDRIKKVFLNISKTYEIILVDDESHDNSWKVLEKEYDKNNNIKIFQLMKNFGQHKATMCGIENSIGNFIITLDDDLQQMPEEIPTLIKKIDQNPNLDVVFGIPKIRKHRTFRNLGSYFVHFLINKIMIKPKNIRVSSFRIFRKKIKEALLNYKGQEIIVSLLLCNITKRLGNVEIRHCIRKEGVSNYTLKGLLRLSLDIIFNFSLVPLKIVSLIGGASFIIATIYAIYIFIAKMFGYITQSGFASLSILIAIFSGLMLFSFGIVGEYIIRILNNVNYKNSYFVRQKKI